MPCTSTARSRQRWRKADELPSLRLMRTAANLDEDALIAQTDAALSQADRLMTELRAKMPFERAAQEASASWKAATGQLFAEAVQARDERLLAAILGGPRSSEHDWKLGLRQAQRLGLLEPPWLVVGGPPANALAQAQELGDGLMASQSKRSYAMLQQCVREVTERRNLTQIVGPVRYKRPEAAKVLGAAEVARLRRGEPLVLDTLLSKRLVSETSLRSAEADLRGLIHRMGIASTSPCNTNSRNAFVPLDGGAGGHPSDGGSTFDLCSGTREVLALLAAIPAEIERHGWPRALSMPPFFQLAQYAASTRARYSVHLDRQPHEKYNRREITILCYLNADWDAARAGGCLRLHPTPVGSGPTTDVEPLLGRVVVFPAGTQQHEVLPCTQGERIALTLWVDHADEQGCG